MTNQQLGLLSAFLIGTASVMAGYEHWMDLTKPTVVAGVMLQVGTMLRGLYTQPKDRS